MEESAGKVVGCGRNGDVEKYVWCYNAGQNKNRKIRGTIEMLKKVVKVVQTCIQKRNNVGKRVMVMVVPGREREAE